MVHAWFDISAGVAGDMLLGSLIDAGADAASVQRAVDAVIPDTVTLSTAVENRAGQRALKATVTPQIPDHPHRSWRTIRELIAGAELTSRVRERALNTFAALAGAEAESHGIDADDVHFHEVGGWDAIADIVGTCAALENLGVDTVTASPVAVGSGRIRSAHGDLPVPVPAVVRLLVGWTTTRAVSSPRATSHPHTRPQDQRAADRHGGIEAPAEVVDGEGELATPTGMALIHALAVACEPLGSIAVTSVGVGAGGRDTSGRPNVVRVVLGDPSGEPARSSNTDIREVAANVDDLDPRLWPGVVEACLGAGALDAWLVPIHMKKGRPGFTLHALVRSAEREAVIETILTGTTTLGVREVTSMRTVLDRAWFDVDVDGHPVPVKIGSRDGRILNAAVEFASLPGLAAALGVAPADALARATAALVAAGLTPGGAVPSGSRELEADR